MNVQPSPTLRRALSADSMNYSIAKFSQLHPYAKIKLHKLLQQAILTRALNCDNFPNDANSIQDILNSLNQLSADETQQLFSQKDARFIQGIYKGNLVVNFSDLFGNDYARVMGVKDLDDLLKNPKDLSKLDLEGVSLRCADLRDANLQGANLQGANLQGANLQGANLQGAKFQDANLANVDLRGRDLRSTNFSGCDLSGANLSCCDLSDSDFSGANVNETKFLNSNLNNTKLPVDLRNAILSEKTTFLSADFRVYAEDGTLTRDAAQINSQHIALVLVVGAKFSHTTFDGKVCGKLPTKHNLNVLMLNKVTLMNLEAHSPTINEVYWKNVSVKNSDLSQASFNNAKLEDVKFEESILGGAIFEGGLLTGSFYKCNMSGTKFEQDGQKLKPKDMKDVSFKECNLSNSEFSRVDLSGVDLSSCELDGCSFRGCILDGVIWPKAATQTFNADTGEIIIKQNPTNK